MPKEVSALYSATQANITIFALSPACYAGLDSRMKRNTDSNKEEEGIRVRFYP